MADTLEEKYRLIREKVRKSGSRNPVAIAKSVMHGEFMAMHGPEHHFLNGATVLVAFKNAGGEVELDGALDELSRRTIKMPGAMCGHWGICGSVASAGAALSVLHGTGPLSDDNYYSQNMEFTSSVIAAMGRIGGPRCCKRNAYLTLSYAVKFVKENYGIGMETDRVACEFTDCNGQCIKKRCPFYQAI